MKKAIGATFVIVVMLAGCSSGAKAKADPSTGPAVTPSPSGSPPSLVPATTPAASATLKVPAGRSIVVQDPSGGQAKITVSSIKKQTTPPTKTSSALQPGQVYVVAHVTFQCVAVGPCEYSQFGDWAAVDSSGTGSDLDAGGVQPTLGAGTVATGHVVSGYITEDASAKADELVYGSGDEPVASWAIQ